MVFPIVGGDGKPTGYDIDNSLRLDDGGSERLYFDQGSGDDTTARRKWTFSTWIKLGNLSTSQHRYFFGVGDYTLIGFRKDDSGEADDLYFQVGTGSGAQGVHTNAKFRDPSAWMHIHAIFDSTDSTAANRLQLRVNGKLVDNELGDYSTDQRSSISQNDEDDFVGNNGQRINIGYSANGTSSFYDGYMVDTHLLIGTAKAYTDFGEFNDNGVWIPIKTSFASSDYGTNGFKLEYKQTGTSANSSGIGADTSGNDNHFTVQNLNAQNVTTDTPTNNFCTLNPLDNYYASSTFSEGNVKMVSASTGSGTSTNAFKTSTFGLTSGKWYWEAKLSNATGYDQIGISQLVASSTSDHLGNSSSAYSIRGDTGNFMNNNSASSYGVSFTTNDIISVALDLDNNLIYFYKNGTVMNSGTGKSISAGTYFPSFGKQDPAAVTWEVNFGNPAFSISSGNTDGKYGNFEYAPPSGYYALCTKRLAEYG